MTKPFADIQTDAEYLRAVGMGPDTHEHLYHHTWTGSEVAIEYHGPSLRLYDTTAALKWANLCNVLSVLGPEMDRRGWYLKTENQKGVCYAWLFDEQHGTGWAMNDLPHIALLEAFYTAHAQGETA